MISKDLMLEYDELLLGNRTTLPQSFFSTNGSAANEQNALDLMRYAFETYLKWTPFELCDWLTWDILILLKLKYVMKYIRFPPELDPVMNPISRLPCIRKCWPVKSENIRRNSFPV